MKQLGGDVVVMTVERQPAVARRDHGRHRARAVALCRCDHDPHAPRRRCSRSWRANATVPVINGLTDAEPSLPDHGRRDDARGAQGAGGGQDRRLVRRRQQCRGELDPRRGALRLRAAPRLPREIAAAGAAARLGASAKRGRVSVTDRSARGGRAAPIASSPTPGCRWGSSPSVNRARHAGSLSRRRAADGAAPSATPSSCIACRPSAARK